MLNTILESLLLRRQTPKQCECGKRTKINQINNVAELDFSRSSSAAVFVYYRRQFFVTTHVISAVKAEKHAFRRFYRSSPGNILRLVQTNSAAAA